MNQQSGKYIIIVGAIIVLVGAVVYFFGNKLHWMGHLPGDIRIEKETLRFYFPLTTMVLLSVLLTLLIHIIRRIV